MQVVNMRACVHARAPDEKERTNTHKLRWSETVAVNPEQRRIKTRKMETKRRLKASQSSTEQQG